MPVTFSLPRSIEENLRARFVDLDAVSKEAALVELYRQGKLSHGEFAQSLEISRDEANAVLKKHQVTEDLLTIDELDVQVSAVRKVIGR